MYLCFFFTFGILNILFWWPSGVGWFNFSKSNKNQVATLILIKINIIFYVENENQINQLMLEVLPGLQSLPSEGELYSFENLHCTVFSVK
jgi:hypothetical protein